LSVIGNFETLEFINACWISDIISLPVVSGSSNFSIILHFRSSYLFFVSETN